MQQDIIDGMQSALSLGIGDRTKLGIYGHSFGGFSALTALSFTPELFKLGIAAAPPIDLSLSIQYLVEQEAKENILALKQRFKHLIVDIDDPEDIRRIRQQSPNEQWQKINKPLLLIAGGQDKRVSIKNVKNFASKLHAAGKDIALLVDDNEGHSFQSQLAQEAYFYALEKMLSEHLGGRCQCEISEDLKRYLKMNMLIDEPALAVKH